MLKPYLNTDEKELEATLRCPECSYKDNTTFEYLFMNGKLYLEFVCDACYWQENFKLELKNNKELVEAGRLAINMVDAIYEEGGFYWKIKIEINVILVKEIVKRTERILK